MSTQTFDELRQFHLFLGEKLGNNASQVSPEEALDEWRRTHPAQNAPQEDLAAIQEALDDLAIGDHGMPFEEFDRDFRARHNLPGKA